MDAGQILSGSHKNPGDGVGNIHVESHHARFLRILDRRSEELEYGFRCGAQYLMNYLSGYIALGCYPYAPAFADITLRYFFVRCAIALDDEFEQTFREFHPQSLCHVQQRMPSASGGHVLPRSIAGFVNEFQIQR